MAALLDYNTLITDIRTLHYNLRAPNKNKKADEKKLHSRLGIFYDRCVTVRIRRANNEKLPWSETDLGIQVLKMETKEVTGLDQVGDYQFELSINGSSWKNLGLCLERKETEDLHNTLLFNLERFQNETKRFLNNPLLWNFRIIVEGSLEDFLNYMHPLPRICKFCTYCRPYHDTKNKINKYFCEFDGKKAKDQVAKIVSPNYRCRNYIEYLKTAKEVEDMRSRKLALIEALEAEGYHVSFYSNRKRAAWAVKTIVKRYFVANYARLLAL